MSTPYYNELWLVTQKDMEKLLHLDNIAQSVKSPKPRNLALKAILPLYLNYRNLVRRLIMCHDQVIQAQKRELIKKVLDCAIGRMLEYHREIVNLESNDYQWPDDLMIKMKITPDDVAIPVPNSYVGDRKILLEHRRAYIEELIEEAEKALSANTQSHEDIEEETTADAAMETLPKSKRRAKVVEVVRVEVPVESPEEKAEKEAREAAKKAFIDAMWMIQAHERARVVRCIAARAEQEYNLRKKVDLGLVEPKKVVRKVKEKAALVIQRYWRGFATRKALKQRRLQTDVMLDMIIPSWADKSVSQRDKDTHQRRMSLQPEALKSLETTTSKERARVFRIDGPGLMEDITDEIREWFLLWYNELGYFDAYPVAELGGSVLVVTGQTFTPEEFLIDLQEKEAEKGAKKKEKEQEKSKESAKDKTKESPEDLGWVMPEGSKALEGLCLAEEEFVSKWRLRDELESDAQREYLDLIDEKLRYELQLEMREVVDELMRLELAKLNAALMRDHAHDEVKFVIPTAEKGKKKKDKKKRGKKDPLADVPIESMFKELVLAQIIRNYPEESLDDWQGDLSYGNYEDQRELRDYQHRLGEIKRSIINYCILPLGSREAHTIAPLVRSVSICGLPRYGKSFLANAIFTAVGPLLFDLTPSVIAGRYEGKKKQDRLMNMIGKLAREYPPAIVFVDGGEKPWSKKLAPADRASKPKRLAKLLPKFVKSIKPGDQLLLLTLATEPQKASKPFLKIHDKFIILPVTDYNTVYMFYKSLLMKYHGVDRNFNVSCLARMSVGYPLEMLGQIVDKVLNLSRRIKLRFRPLDSQEILDELLTYEPPNAKTLGQFKNFELRTPLGKSRATMLSELREARDNPQAQKKNKK